MFAIVARVDCVSRLLMIRINCLVNGEKRRLIIVRILWRLPGDGCVCELAVPSLTLTSVSRSDQAVWLSGVSGESLAQLGCSLGVTSVLGGSNNTSCKLPNGMPNGSCVIGDGGLLQDPKPQVVYARTPWPSLSIGCRACPEPFSTPHVTSCLGRFRIAFRCKPLRAGSRASQAQLKVVYRWRFLTLDTTQFHVYRPFNLTREDFDKVAVSCSALLLGLVLVSYQPINMQNSVPGLPMAR